MIWLKLGVCLALAGGPALATQLASGRPIGGSLEGEWGGDRLQLVIDSNGGRVEMDCASGTIKGPITLSSNGTFLAMGTFEQHQGGPQRADQEPAPASARYSGEVKDDAMKLKIQSAGVRNAQEFNLRKGARVKLIRCR